MTMRINYLAQDRPDLQFAGKEPARGMSAPPEGDWQKLKKLGRYLFFRPTLVLNYYCQNKVTFLDSKIDTDTQVV